MNGGTMNELLRTHSNVLISTRTTWFTALFPPRRFFLLGHSHTLFQAVMPRKILERRNFVDAITLGCSENIFRVMNHHNYYFLLADPANLFLPYKLCVEEK